MCFLCSCGQLTSVCRLGVWGTTAKVIMLYGNFVQSFLGPIFVGLGLSSFLMKGDNDLTNVNWYSTPLMVTGFFIYVLCMTGFFAALKELKWLAFLYALIMVVVVAGQAVLWYYGLNNVEDRIRIWITWVFERPKWRDYFHIAESAMFCCGLDGGSSYTTMGLVIPSSCCDDPFPLNNNSLALTCHANHTYRGCADVAPAYVQNLTDTIGGNVYYVFGVEVHCCGLVVAKSYELLPASCCRTPVLVPNSTSLTCNPDDAYLGRLH